MAMVVNRDAARAKCDAEIAAILQQEYWPGDVPVMLVLVTENEALESVAAAVQSLGGSVLHMLRPLSAISAYVPKSAILTLAERTDVVSLEIDAPVHIA